MVDKADRVRINLSLTRFQSESLKRLVALGLYMEQTAAVRDALRRLFQVYGIEPPLDELVEKAE